MEEPDKVRRGIGLRIVELRRAQKITQDALAERLEMDTRDLRRIEAGNVNMTIDTLVKIANALQVNAVDLWQRTTSQALRKPGRPRV